MPELPDVEAYVEALRQRFVGQQLVGTRLANPFLLRTVDPPLSAMLGRRIVAIQRLGKRIVICNYCPRCQTGGKVLADRALSRLLKDAWPRTVEDLERRS